MSPKTVGERYNGVERKITVFVIHFCVLIAGKIDYMCSGVWAA